MFKRILTTAAITTTVVFLSVSASSAAVFDFQRMADDNTYTPYHGEKGFSTLGVTIGGINLKATGSATNDDDNQQYAYLDKGRAGLGVCKDLTGGLQCAPSSDDNVTYGETLSLVFDTKVVIDSITFRDSGHNIWEANDNGFFSLQIDDNGFNATPFAPFPAMLMGTEFDFKYLLAKGSDWQFYIDSITVSAVPLPPALLLFGAALGGIGFLGRRRKEKAASIA